jgi:hypothetical protein
MSNKPQIFMGYAVVQLRQCAVSRKVAGSISDWVIEDFSLTIFPAALSL